MIIKDYFCHNYTKLLIVLESSGVLYHNSLLKINTLQLLTSILQSLTAISLLLIPTHPDLTIPLYLTALPNKKLTENRGEHVQEA